MIGYLDKLKNVSVLSSNIQLMSFESHTVNHYAVYIMYIINMNFILKHFGKDHAFQPKTTLLKYFISNTLAIRPV